MLVVVPLAIPDFVVSFGWASLSTAVQGFRGAVLVMTLALYPLVYLPVAASLRTRTPARRRSPAASAWPRADFWRVTVGQARAAILGGCLLVSLAMLAEYGAFEILGYQTFTTEIFTEFSLSFDIPAACALSLVLVALGLVVLGGDGGLRGAAASAGPDRTAQRATPRTGSALALAGARRLLAALVLAGARRPGRLGRLLDGASRRQPPLDGVSLLSARRVHRRSTAPARRRCATVLALPVALLAVRHGGRLAPCCWSAAPTSSWRMPGLVIALALSYFSEPVRRRLPLPERAACWSLAYAILFFPLALVGVRASVAQAPAGLEEVARSLGQRRLAVLWPGHAAARRARPGRRVLPGLPLRR